MTMTYKPKGVCSQEIRIRVEDGVVAEINFHGGCHGNLQGVAALAVGRTVDEVVERLSNIHCGDKPTSCPDQLAQALKSML